MQFAAWCGALVLDFWDNVAGQASREMELRSQKLFLAPRVGIAMVNAALILFGFWCYVGRVRNGHRSGRDWAWFWTLLEASNGTGHLLLAAGWGAYVPGAATAPLLLGFSGWLGVTLGRAQSPAHVPRARGSSGNVRPPYSVMC